MRIFDDRQKQNGKEKSKIGEAATDIFTRSGNMPINMRTIWINLGNRRVIRPLSKSRLDTLKQAIH